MRRALLLVALALAWAAAFALLTVLSACQASRTPPRLAPAADELANVTYAGVYIEPITLVEGVWEGEPFQRGAASRPRVELARDFRLVADLDGRRGAEAVVLLTESSGGSGSFGYVAVVGWRKGELVNLGTATIGDRVEVRSARIANGQVVLRVVEAGPEDAACCPSQKAIRVFALTGKQDDGENGDGGGEGLREVRHEITGTLSLADLADVEWVLTHFSWEQPAPATPELTLRFDGSRISGASGCNRYFAEVETGVMPGDIRIGPIGSTRMMCPEPQMRLEQQYLATLGKTLKYGFATGRLYLLSSGSGALTTLLFESRPITTDPRAGQEPKP